MFTTPTDYHASIQQHNEDTRWIGKERAKGYRALHLDLMTVNEYDIKTVVSRRHNYTLVFVNGGEYTAPKNSHDGDKIKTWLND